MEYEFNASQTLLLKKIFILFRHISTNLQIVASANGLNLYALNSTNSAWLHIQLGKSFFRRIDCSSLNEEDGRSKPQQKHWVVATRNLCQALTIVTPSGPRNQLYGAVFLRDIGNCEDNTVRAAVALEKLIIREETRHSNLLSFILNCAGEHIQRTATISFEECKLSVPDDLRWKNWHYLRMQPTVIYKSIHPYWSPFDDVSITYDSERDHILLNILKSVIKNTNKQKSKLNRKAGISGRITINSSHFQKVELDENIPPPRNITVALKELLFLSSFCESVKTNLALILRKPGDPVVALFGEAASIVESATGNLNIHQAVAAASSQYDADDQGDTTIISHPNAWSGSLWLSTNEVMHEEEIQEQLEAKEVCVHDQASTEQEAVEDDDNESEAILNFAHQTGHQKQLLNKPQIEGLTNNELDLIYRTLCLDFIQIQGLQQPQQQDQLIKDLTLKVPWQICTARIVVMNVVHWLIFGNALAFTLGVQVLRGSKHTRAGISSFIKRDLAACRFNIGKVCNNYKFTRFQCNANESYYPKSKHSKVNFEYKPTIKEDPFEYAAQNYDMQIPRVIRDALDEDVGDTSGVVKTKVTLPFIADENQFVPPQEFNDTKPRPKSKGPNAITIDPSLIFQTPHEEHIVVGEIGSPYGLKGYVKIKSHTVNPLLWLCKPGFRYVKNLYDDRILPIKIVHGKRISPEEIYAVKFEGINCSEHALRLKGCYLTTQLDNVPPLEEDCYYSQDLLQCDVYLFNDATKTLLGKSVDFLHRTRFVTTKKCTDLTEDLLDVEMNIQISLDTLINLTKNRRIDPDAPRGVGIVTERDLESAEVVDAEEEFQSEDMSGVQYVRYYTCSKCNKDFTNYDKAVAHDLAGCNDDAVDTIGAKSNEIHQGEANTDPTIRITRIDDVAVAKLKHPVRRFYIPLIKNETIRCVDAPNKSIYIDPATIFIGEDGR